MAVKMAMSLAALEIQSGAAGIPVTIIQAFSAHGYAAKLSEGVPVVVQLPR